MREDDFAGKEGTLHGEQTQKPGRNDPCHCGSGKKYKKCCSTKDEASRPKNRIFEYAAKIFLIHSSDRYPVERCLINDNWQKTRLAQIIVSREFEPGQLIFGVYLVDLGCMGVKSSFCNAGIAVDEFEGPILTKLCNNMTMVPIGVQYAKEIIEGAVTYANALGLKPDADFHLAQHVLGKETMVPTHDVRFGGDDGKPLYVAGPHDDVNRIMQQLTQKVGKNGFHFIYPLEVLD